MHVLHALTIQLLFITLSAAPLQQASATPAATQSAEPPLPPGSNYDPSLFQAPLPPADLAYLQQFAGTPAKDLLRDKQFKKLMKLFIPGCNFHYGKDMSISDALSMAFDGSRIPVELRDNRYLLVAGQNGPYLQGRGFLWIDLQTGIALGGFYFAPTNGEPTPALNLFSRQIKENTLGLSQLPPAFVEDFVQWMTSARVGPVVTRYFITGNNKKILLEHDEDFCVSANGTVAPRNGICEQLNAQAGDLDVTAADYLEQVHHATDATAGMIMSSSQVAWLGVRDRTCGGVLDPLACRINISHQRTHALTGRAPARAHR
jgi:uncharacterized protein YecT (DUF1311 family)